DRSALFFSSSRRHTRSKRDWSSDVCSSDLFSASLLVIILFVVLFPNLLTSVDPRTADLSNSLGKPQAGHIFGFDRQGYDVFSRRSEERRVGKAGCSSRPAWT